MNKKIFALAVPFLFCFALNLAAGGDPGTAELYLNLSASNRLTDLLNAKYLLLGPKAPAPQGGSRRRDGAGDGARCAARILGDVR